MSNKLLKCIGSISILTRTLNLGLIKLYVLYVYESQSGGGVKVLGFLPLPFQNPHPSHLHSPPLERARPGCYGVGRGEPNVWDQGRD
jgi:hypothetical protein